VKILVRGPLWKTVFWIMMCCIFVDSWVCLAAPWQLTYSVGQCLPSVICCGVQALTSMDLCRCLPKPAPTSFRLWRHRQLMFDDIVSLWRNSLRHCRRPWITCCRWPLMTFVDLQWPLLINWFAVNRPEHSYNNLGSVQNMCSPFHDQMQYELRWLNQMFNRSYLLTDLLT